MAPLPAGDEEAVDELSFDDEEEEEELSFGDDEPLDAELSDEELVRLSVR